LATVPRRRVAAELRFLAVELAVAKNSLCRSDCSRRRGSQFPATCTHFPPLPRTSPPPAASLLLGSTMHRRPAYYLHQRWKIRRHGACGFIVLRSAAYANEWRSGSETPLTAATEFALDPQTARCIRFGLCECRCERGSGRTISPASPQAGLKVARRGSGRKEVIRMCSGIQRWLA
jgi:hypothetical protein